MQQLFDWLADGASLTEFIDDFRIDRAAAELVLRTAGAQFCRQLCGQRLQALAADARENRPA